jgi:hypothetical protein
VTILAAVVAQDLPNLCGPPWRRQRRVLHVGREVRRRRCLAPAPPGHCLADVIPRTSAMPARVTGLPGGAEPLSVMSSEMRVALPAAAAVRIMVSVITGRYHVFWHPLCTAQVLSRA